MAKSNSLSYPFIPKNNASLQEGQFFSFRLADERYACVRILATRWGHKPGSRTLFLAGLQDWSGDHPATSEDLVGVAVIDQGWAHVIVIQDYDSQIAGIRPLQEDRIVPDLNCQSVYGREVLRIYANHRLAKPA
jgi:hypothetical protein